MKTQLFLIMIFFTTTSLADLAKRSREGIRTGWNYVKTVANFVDRPAAGTIGRAPTKFGQKIAFNALNSKRNQFASRLYCDPDIWTYNTSLFNLAPGKLACASVVSAILAKSGCDTGLSDIEGGRVLSLKQKLIDGGFKSVSRKQVRAGDIVFWTGENTQRCRNLGLNYPNHVGVAINNYATVDNSSFKSSITRVKSIHVHKINRSCQKFSMALRPPKTCPFKQKRVCKCSLVNRLTPLASSAISTCKWQKPGKIGKLAKLKNRIKKIFSRKKRRSSKDFK